ncbi:hypothetical protein [Methylotetracoccus oryzae]|uniref:hypothetical protein n=1 Tax=Methylotetracoccus oryzae TaxID=1919059 RepID=UPI00111B8F84|nr:hypothetical protein [Methylotetracoccus oryzae]
MKLDVTEAERLGKLRLTPEQAATVLEVPLDSPGLAEAVERGRAQGLAEVTAKLFELADAGNTGAKRFLAANPDIVRNAP